MRDKFYVISAFAMNSEERRKDCVDNAEEYVAMLDEAIAKNEKGRYDGRFDTYEEAIDFVERTNFPFSYVIIWNGIVLLM